MTKNPFYNALLATGYITLVVSVIMYGPQLIGGLGRDNILMPIGMLSLFVLSAAVMGFVFFYQPVLIFMDGDRSSAVKLFLKTVATFAVLTVLVAAAAILVSKM